MVKKKRPGLFATQTRRTSYKPRKPRVGYVYRVKWSTRLKRWTRRKTKKWWRTTKQGIRRKWRTTKQRIKRRWNNRSTAKQRRQTERKFQQHSRQIHARVTTVQPGPDGQPTAVTTDQATAKGPPPEGATSTCKLGGACGQPIVYTGGRWEHVEGGSYECFQPHH